MTEDIRQEYSEPRSGASEPERPVFYAIDSGSPVSSVALGSGTRTRMRAFRVGDSSGRLLSDLDGLLAEAGSSIGALGGLVALRGPGSFTGLRVGLATILGLHQALQLPATAVTTFEALAWQARRRHGPSDRPIVAAVDALREECFVQVFDGRSLEPLDEPEVWSNAALAGFERTRIAGFGLDRLKEHLGDSPSVPELFEAEALAADLIAIASADGFAWNPETLTEPLYLRPPAVTRGG
ncbi:MAG: tRNA (adenosine(37)-N6)-threonylcarbamoyltransferase complex dimerization subunit type 1 TsaB [Thermoanaerobaculia bacterium]